MGRAMRSIVVVGYDRSLASGRAVLEAGREAACRGGEVVVVHAYPQPVGGIDEAAREAAQATADFGAAVLRRHLLGLPVRGQATAGVPHEVLTAAARGADMLVLGARGDDGTMGQALGSVATRTLACTPCPTMVVRGLPRDPRGLVLAAVDVGDPADQVLSFAFAEARFRSARLQVLSAFDLTEVRTALDDAQATAELCEGLLAEAAAELDRIVKERQDRCARVQASSRLVEGAVTAVLTTASEHADAIVTGARRLDGEKRGTRVGPVTEVLLRHAACPVVIVPYA
jgi:nucleotide-binding universal stress UspA family protein